MGTAYILLYTAYNPGGKCDFEEWHAEIIIYKLHNGSTIEMTYELVRSLSFYKVILNMLSQKQTIIQVGVLRELG